ncbi:hypothetical protein [Paraferrimonas sp. SM1919]|uniref:hypothetical protein n=1 Tax=Paraferrimonas sp. SM1919 TaxID=2662263 RepID=UPI0013D503CF|nr:hypothetical protein [Paraferrimonas sp. SM1919]
MGSSDYIKRLGVVLLGLISCACVPTISTVYHTPQVSGVLIDGASLQPAAGYNVYFESHPEHLVTTGADGAFSLPALPETMLHLQMPASAVKDNYLVVVKQANPAFFTPLNFARLSYNLQSSLKMTSVEVNKVDYLFVYTQEVDYSIKPVTAKGANLKNLKLIGYPHGPFGHCELTELPVVESIHLYRKLWHNFGDNPTSQQSTLINAAKKQAFNIWQAFYYSCSTYKTSAYFSEVSMQVFDELYTPEEIPDFSTLPN